MKCAFRSTNDRPSIHWDETQRWARGLTDKELFAEIASRCSDLPGLDLQDREFNTDKSGYVRDEISVLRTEQRWRDNLTNCCTTCGQVRR